MTTALKISGLVLLLLVVGFAADLVKRGPRDISLPETIAGIPYPAVDDVYYISETLAHADIYLRESVFAKQLNLTVRFHPGNTRSLAVGVRENDFWLSYPKVSIWDAGEPAEWQEKTVRISLTNAFQETDRSLDLMFFAETDTPTDIDAGVEHTASWQLQVLSANVDYVWPDRAAIQDYVRSILKRERAQ